MPDVAVPLSPTWTLTVRAEDVEDLAVAVTVTEVALAPSPTLDGLADRAITCLSSSVSLRDVPVTVWPPLLLPDIDTVSSPSTDVSCAGVSSNDASAMDWPLGS